MSRLLRKAFAYQPPAQEGFRLTFEPAAQPTEAVSETPAVASQRPLGMPGYQPWRTVLPIDLRAPVPRLEANLTAIGILFHLPSNRDLVIRRFTLELATPVKAAAVYLDGLCDRNLQDLVILSPLMVWPRDLARGTPARLCDLVQDRLLPANQVARIVDWQVLIEGVTSGQTAILIDTCREILLVESKGWDRRGVAAPKTETVLRGPQEAFNETLRSNTALVRRRLRSPHLITETFTVGQLSATACSIMYLEGLANPALVAEVRRRLTGIKTDYISDSGTLEQLIEDNYWSPFPTLLATERPDRVTSMLAEGRVAILLDGDPFVLVAPMNFYALLHSAEDSSLRWIYSNLLRFVRALAAITALFLPGLYVALVNFHQEMIPTDLLLAIAGSRERVPLPSAVELLIMEVAFELIREAGIRVPWVAGQTVSIFGAVVLGQAAVTASIVSPIAVIVVALTALGSFSIPSNALGHGLRLGRFLFLIVGATYGFVGIALGLVVIALSMAGLHSFGVPYLAPIAPHVPASSDTLYRGPAWQQEDRPAQFEPLSGYRQPKKSRPWRRGGTDG